MPTSGWKKWIAGVAGAVVLGAFGSGLWELAIKPGGVWFFQAVLSAVTFGSKHLKDQVYLQAARGHHEAIAGDAVMLLFVFLGLFTGAALHMLSEIHRPDIAESSAPKFVFKSSRFLSRALGVSLLALSAFMLVRSAESQTATDLCTFFDQSLSICSPYLDDHEVRLLKARFAALRSRDEYIEMTDQLRRIASANHVKLPDYTPW
jgi:hypothetical protein